MMLAKFLMCAQDKVFWENVPVMCLRTGLDVQLFLRLLWQQLIAIGVFEELPGSLEIDKTGKEGLIATLSTQFLGQTRTYIVTSIPAKSDKKTKELIKYLLSYTGPHRIILLLKNGVELPKKVGSYVKVIDVGAEITEPLFPALAQALGYEKNAVLAALTKRAFSLSKTLNLDIACLLLRYSDVVGARRTSLFLKQLPRIIEPQQSLLGQARHFWARDAASFFDCWHVLGELYAPMFWISFFSEQLWQAHAALPLLAKGNVPNAKRVGWRLPFHFMHSSWKIYTREELTRAHNLLYEIDFGIKNGAHQPSLEIFFSNHFGKL